MGGCGSRLLPAERFKYPHREVSATGEAVRSTQNQTRVRMARNCLEDLSRVLGGERGLPLEQSGSMPQRNIQCPYGLRSAVQLNIQSIPAYCSQLIRISRSAFVKSTTNLGGASMQPNSKWRGRISPRILTITEFVTY